MNDRIKELAEKATINIGDEDHDPIEFFHKEKFAELIIKECIDLAEEESERYLSWSTEDCDNFAKVMQNYQELLKEHFGIEK